MFPDDLRRCFQMKRKSGGLDARLILGPVEDVTGVDDEAMIRREPTKDATDSSETLLINLAEERWPEINSNKFIKLVIGCFSLLTQTKLIVLRLKRIDDLEGYL